MPGPKPMSLTLSEKQHFLLEHLSRCQSSPHRLVRRVQTILAAADGLSNEAIARHLNLCRDTVRDWRQRWRDGAEALEAAEAAGDADKVLLARIEALLDDAPRSGSPGDFSAEQLAQIISVACESPEDSGRPVIHWTPRELADEVIGSVSKVEMAIFTPPVQRRIDSQTTRSRCRASALILRSRSSSAPGI